MVYVHSCIMPLYYILLHVLCIALVQGCDMWQMIECAGVIAECAAVCALGIDDPDCIECMGDLYDTCKDCFSTMEATEKQAGKPQEIH